MEQPPILDTRAYRRTMGLFATGVTVLTAAGPDGEIIGMTANSLTSVSLDPLLLLVCVDKTANIAPYLLEGDWFSLSILAETHGVLSDYFAGLYNPPEPPPFHFEAWPGGVRIAEGIGAVGCTRRSVLDGGDHWIVLGDVIALYQRDNPPPPLVFFAGQYRRLMPGGEDHR